MRDLLRILSLWRGRTGWLVAGAVLSVAALGVGVALMVLSGQLLSIALVAGVLAVPGLLRLTGGARVVLRYLERLVTHEATFRALADLRVLFFRRLAATTAGGLGFRRTGDMLARMVADIDALDSLYLRILVPLLGAVLLLPALVVVVGRMSATVAVLVAALFVVAALVLPWVVAGTARAAGRDLAAQASGLRVAALDAMTGLREVRAFAAEGRMLAQIQAREAALLASQHAMASRLAWAGAGSFLCGQAALLCVLAAAGLSPILAIPVAFLVVAVFEATAGLARAGALAGHAAGGAARVLAVIDAPVAAPSTRPAAAMPAVSGLRFENVGFRWQADRPAVFDGLSLDIPPGSRIAVLGPSGAGKSTLAALALKVVAPQTGRVLLGGADIASLDTGAVRGRIAWLSQATHLFDDTIRANLLLALPGASDAALWAALDAARIGETVRGLPDGLDSWVGEGGARFSGGQGRRLALARTLLSPAPILILDEPCVGLDSETERAFFATLNEVADGRTIILIAHRLLGVERLDRIWRLSGGTAVAAAA